MTNGRLLTYLLIIFLCLGIAGTLEKQDAQLLSTYTSIGE